MSNQIKKGLIFLTGGVSVILAHHYGSKVLDYKNTKAAEIASEEQHLDLKESIKTINDKVDVLINRAPAAQEKAKGIIDRLKQAIDDLGWRLRTQADKHITDPSMANNQELAQQKAVAVKKCFKELSNAINETGQNFRFNLNSFYDFLDTLSLLEESALFHLFILSFILLTIINIVITLFSNEIIAYFNIENKHPYLKKILNLRAKFQRYYLIWNFILLILACLLGLFLNFLLLW
jgi:hypothetical protein